MATLTPEEVRFLSFEGGGGKGIAYVGALRVLEAKGVLSAKPDLPQGIEGVAGASAGAITAFLVGAGFRSAEIEAALADPATSEAFYDGPACTKLRHVDRNVYQQGRTAVFEPPTANYLRWHSVGETQVALWRETIDNLPFPLLDAASVAAIVIGADVVLRAYGDVLSGLVGARLPVGVGDVLGEIGQTLTSPVLPTALFGLNAFISLQIKQWCIDQLKDMAEKQPEYAGLVKALTASPNVLWDYLYNILFDRGLFPGFAIRAFLVEQLATRIKATSRRGTALSDASARRQAETMTLKTYCQRFGVQFRVAGVNIVTSKPAWFDGVNTPSFPVVDAVAISSSVPPAFKPVLVTNCENVDDGYWLDGGVLNNLPLHAFDTAGDGPLNPGVLGIRLEDLGPPAGIDRDPEDNPLDQVPSEGPKAMGLLEVLGSHIAGLMNTLMFPSEEGQIRTTEERDHTISLNTYGLNTLEFAPAEKRRRAAILSATRTVDEYFSEAVRNRKGDPPGPDARLV